MEEAMMSFLPRALPDMFLYHYGLSRFIFILYLK